MGDSDHEADDYTSFFLQSPDNPVDLLSVLKDCFEKSHTDFSRFSVMSGTISPDGVDKIHSELMDFCADGGRVEIFIGLGLGPSAYALRTLRDIKESYPDSFSLHLVDTHGDAGLFHPKIYWFTGSEADLAIVSSANWSGSGLVSSVEASSVFRAENSDEKPQFVNRLEQAFESIRPEHARGSDWVTLYPPNEEILTELEATSSETVSSRTSTEIDLSDVPSESDTLWPLRTGAPILVLDVLKESRGTQLVPTDEVWEEFFGVDSDEFNADDPFLPSLELTNIRTGDTVSRPVVPHDHQGTIEIPELRERSNPGEGNDFIIFVKNEEKKYTYDAYFEEIDADTVDEIENFIQTHGFKTGNKRRAFIRS